MYKTVKQWTVKHNAWNFQYVFANAKPRYFRWHSRHVYSSTISKDMNWKMNIFIANNKFHILTIPYSSLCALLNCICNFISAGIMQNEKLKVSWFFFFCNRHTHTHTNFKFVEFILGGPGMDVSKRTNKRTIERKETVARRCRPC